MGYIENPIIMRVPPTQMGTVSRVHSEPASHVPILSVSCCITWEASVVVSERRDRGHKLESCITYFQARGPTMVGLNLKLVIHVNPKVQHI